MRFDTINPGDVVLVKDAICYGTGWARGRVDIYLEQTVTRTTEKQLTISTGKRFMRETGREVGGNTVAYPVGAKISSFGKEPTILAGTPEGEIRRIRDAIKLANGVSEMAYQLSKGNDHFYRAVKDQAAFDALRELKAAITKYNELMHPEATPTKG